MRMYVGLTGFEIFLLGSLVLEQEFFHLSKMQGAVLVAIAASIGNLLQGWDNATIAGF